MADNIWVKEVLTDEKNNCITYNSEVYETRYNSIKELFCAMQKNYGKCVSYVYRDFDGGILGQETQKIGWVFEKRVKYSDCDEYFKQTAWITLHTKEPEKVTKYFYKIL